LLRALSFRAALFFPIVFSVRAGAAGLRGDARERGLC
jgi:hypothetical protein